MVDAAPGTPGSPCLITCLEEFLGCHARLVVPPPGIPVGSLVAKGEVALGFQQMSELISLSGINILGKLPQDVAFITTFCAAIPSAVSSQPERIHAIKDFFHYLSSETTHEVKRAHGMSPMP